MRGTPRILAMSEVGTRNGDCHQEEKARFGSREVQINTLASSDMSSESRASDFREAWFTRTPCHCVTLGTTVKGLICDN